MMKKITLLLTTITLAIVSQAQDYESIKNFLLLNQYKKAREELDKKMPNAKFASKPEAYILKATIYSGMAADSAVRSTPEGIQLEADAEQAFMKYKEMEPSLEKLKDPIYKNSAINIYSNIFTAGYKDYEAQQWDASFEKFKKVSEYSDLLASQKLLNSAVDTNVLILAAYTAEKSNHRDDAAKYYTKLADAKVKGEGFEGVYRFLTTYSYDKKDMPSFEKYKDLGKELYPKSEFFTYDKVDFAVGLEDNLNSKLKSLEQVVAGDPTNYKANLSIGQLIYDTLHSTKDGAVKPANAAELTTKMVTAFTKASEAMPESEIAFLYLGDHNINNSIEAGDAKDALAKKPKPSGKPTPEDAKKKIELEKAYGDALEAARVPYEKAAEIFAKKTTLTGQERQQYKKVAGYLGDIYTYKREQAKGKPAAEIAKLAELEKKWNDLYATIK